jgi:hypothetical protein
MLLKINYSKSANIYTNQKVEFIFFVLKKEVDIELESLDIKNRKDYPVFCYLHCYAFQPA